MARVIGGLVLLDFVNWNFYYDESNAIVELHRQLEEEIQAQSKAMQLERDQIYLKKS
jgi:hypothetical protein